VIAALFGLLEALIARQTVVTGFDDDAEDNERLSLHDSLRHYVSRLYGALAAGIRSGLPVIAVCAAAGIITSTIAKTGLGQILADSLVKAAEALAPNQATLVALTALFAAIAILILGLAVPVTASFILSWVIIGPALIQLGVGAPETAMFIFYYAVLSEVSPPTALAAVASAAITGGKVIPTMWQACKYTLPAFLAPLAFVITDNGSLLLGRGNIVAVVGATLVCGLAVCGLAVATTGWMFGPTRLPERLLALAAALLLLYLEPVSMVIGGVVLAAAVALHLLTRKKNSTPTPGSPQQKEAVTS
jgi:TRAP-type uncharacterized transport system fused permease subunit